MEKNEPMNGSDAASVSAAREAYDRRDWALAFQLFAEADDQGQPARIAGAAGANDIVVSVETITGRDIQVPTSEPRELELKGLAAPVPVVAIEWRS